MARNCYILYPFRGIETANWYRYSADMNQIASTMPEARFRTTKKRVQPVRSIRTSEFAHEVKAFQPRPEKAATETERRKFRLNFVAFWPVAVGLFLAGFAPEWQEMAGQAGVWAMRIAFPLALLASHREVGIDSQVATMLPQIALYAQLPLDGLLTMLTLARGKSLRSAIAQLFLVHGVCAFVLWLLSFAN